jgi:hypothetical protein
MQKTKWRRLIPCLFLVLWWSLCLATAIHASSPARPHRDDCAEYFKRGFAEMITAPRAAIEDCQRTPGWAAFQTAALAGLFGTLLATALQQALLASGRMPVPGVLPPIADPYRLTTYPDDNEWRNRVARDMWQAEREGRDPERVIEMYRGDPNVMRDLRARYQGYRSGGLSGPDEIPSRDLGSGPGVPGRGVILEQNEALTWLQNHGARTITGPDGRTYVPTSAINSIDGCGGGAYHTRTINGVEVIDPSKPLAIVKR